MQLRPKWYFCNVFQLVALIVIWWIIFYRKNVMKFDNRPRQTNEQGLPLSLKFFYNEKFRNDTFQHKISLLQSFQFWHVLQYQDQISRCFKNGCGKYLQCLLFKLFLKQKSNLKISFHSSILSKKPVMLSKTRILFSFTTLLNIFSCSCQPSVEQVDINMDKGQFELDRANSSAKSNMGLTAVQLFFSFTRNVKPCLKKNLRR